jgi:hypothetical protein
LFEHIFCHISKYLTLTLKTTNCNFDAGKFKNDLTFWTSGAIECGPGQAQIWCSLGTQVQRSDVTWVDASKQPSATERCVTLQTKADGNFRLDYSQCSATKSVLCEVNN